MKIQVTQKHIKEGQRCNPFLCPVAMAISDVIQTKNVTDISVGSDIHIKMPKDNVLLIIKTSQEIANFIDRFDQNQTVEPFEFELEYHEI